MRQKASLLFIVDASGRPIEETALPQGSSNFTSTACGTRRAARWAAVPTRSNQSQVTDAADGRALHQGSAAEALDLGGDHDARSNRNRPGHEYNHLLDRKVTSSSILPRKRRKLGNQVDLLSVTPDS